MADCEIRRIADSTPSRCAVPTVRWRVTLTVSRLSGETLCVSARLPSRDPVLFRPIRLASLPSCPLTLIGKKARALEKIWRACYGAGGDLTASSSRADGRYRSEQ